MHSNKSVCVHLQHVCFPACIKVGVLTLTFQVWPHTPTANLCPWLLLLMISKWERERERERERREGGRGEGG